MREIAVCINCATLLSSDVLVGQVETLHGDIQKFLTALDSAGLEHWKPYQVKSVGASYHLLGQAVKWYKEEFMESLTSEDPRNCLLPDTIVEDLEKLSHVF